MKKKRPPSPSTPPELPESAKQWLDQYRAQRDSDDPQLTAVYQQLDELASQLHLPRYSLKAFRDLHFLHYPETSVAALPISDALFLDVIWAGAYTIAQLEQKLESGEMTLAGFHYSGMGENGEGIERLTQALKEWRTSRQESALPYTANY